MESNNVANNKNNRIFCQYCGEYFTKENKPKIMKCSHNLCSNCYHLNSSLLFCLICKEKYTKRDISKFPINFSLLDLTEKLSKNTDINNNNIIDTKKDLITNDNCYIYYCSKCNLYFNTEYHNKVFSNHSLIKKEVSNPKDENIKIKNDSKNIIDSLNKFNEDFKLLNEDFADKFLNLLTVNYKEFKNNDKLINKIKSKPFNLLKYCGLINEFDRKILKDFYTKIYKNNIYMNIINNSKSFNDLINSLNNINENETYYLSPNKFFELLFNFKDVYDNKLINLDKNLNILLNKLENSQNYKEKYYEELSFKISYSIYDILTSINYQLNYFIIEDKIFVFEPIEEKFHQFKLDNNVDYKNIKTYLITPDFKMFYMLNNSDIYVIELNNDKQKIKLQNSNFNFVDNNYNNCLFYVGNILYNISQISLEKLDLNEDMSENKWIILSMYNEHDDEQINNPKYVSSKISSFYIVDSNKNNDNSIYEYTILKDKWTKKNFSFKHNNDLFIQDANFINFNHLILFGGINTITNKHNQNYYNVNLKKKEAKLLFSLPLIKDDFNIIYHNISFLNGKEYTIVVYQNLQNCKNYLFNVWKKRAGDNEKYILMDNLTMELNL